MQLAGCTPPPWFIAAGHFGRVGSSLIDARKHRPLIVILAALLALTLASAADTTMFHETWDTAVVTPPDTTAWAAWARESQSPLLYNDDTYADIQLYGLRVFDQSCTIAVNMCSVRTSSHWGAGDNSEHYVFGFSSFMRQTVSVPVTDSLNTTFWYMNEDPGTSDLYVRVDFANCGRVALLLTAGSGSLSNTVEIQTITPTGTVSQPVGDLPTLDTWYRITAKMNVTQDLAQAFIHDSAGTLLKTSDPITLPCSLSTSTATEIELEARHTAGWDGNHYHIDDLQLVDPEGVGDEPLSVDDDDSDGFSDSVERVLCGRNGIRNLLANDLGGIAGSCSSSTDYDPPTTPEPPIKEIRLPIPNGVSNEGPDADSDGYPSYVAYETNTFVIDLEDPQNSGVDSDAGDALVIPVDPNDNNSNIPAPQNTCQLIGIPTATVTRDDNDNDGVPGSIIVASATLCVDTSTTPPTYSFTEGDTVQEIAVDPDDSDPNNPVASVYTTPNIISNVTYGPDADNDKIPAYVRYYHVNYTIDANDPTTAPVPSYGYTQTTWDPNDNNRNDPVPFLSSADGDGDWIPTIVEPTLCDYQDDNIPQDGDCNLAQTDYIPPSWFQQVISSVP